jgi:predicted DCC family thiol-disulfide oxidoreductase YuxK
MKTLYVLFDQDCGLCCRLSEWLGRQPAHVAIQAYPLQAPDLGMRFPGIERLRPEEDLVAVSDEGDVWRGSRAWIVCLWALKEFRPWAKRFESPAWAPLAKRMFVLVSKNRRGISRWLFGSQTEEPRLLRALESVPDPCLGGGCRMPQGARLGKEGV